MLIGRPTEFGSGIEIFGDYWDLKSLYNTVHILAGTESIPGHILFMDLAYEIRKANNNHRETDTFEFADELIIYRGFKIFWVPLFVTVKFMREHAGFMIATAEIQADIYRLESIIEICLKAYDQNIGSGILDFLNYYSIPRTSYIDLLIRHITFKNLKAKNGKQRFKQLRKDIEMLLYNHPDHIDFKKYVETEAKRLDCKIEDIDMEVDFNKTGFKW